MKFVYVSVVAKGTLKMTILLAIRTNFSAQLESKYEQKVAPFDRDAQLILATKSFIVSISTRQQIRKL